MILTRVFVSYELVSIRIVCFHLFYMGPHGPDVPGLTGMHAGGSDWAGGASGILLIPSIPLDQLYNLSGFKPYKKSTGYMVNHGSFFCSNLHPIYVGLSKLRHLRHLCHLRNLRHLRLS